MRLIDADALKEYFPHDEDWDYPVNTNDLVVELIDSMPKVEAIPVKFIIKKSRELIMSGQFDLSLQLDSLIDDWMAERKEE